MTTTSSRAAQQPSLFEGERRAIGTRQCRKCLRFLPATLVYFCAEKRTKIGLQSWCRECLNAHRRASREANPEKERAYQQLRRTTKPESERERVRKWRADNPEQFKEQARRHHANHRSERNANARERIKRYYKEHPERWQVAGQVRRSRKHAAGGSFSAKEWQALKAKNDYRCLCCGMAEPIIKLTVDHVVPLCKGGRNSIDNIQPLCFPCNLKKRTQIIDYRPWGEQALLVEDAGTGGDV